MSVQELSARLPLQAARVNAGWTRSVLTAALSCGCFLLLAALYTRAAWTVPINSDHASILLEAEDVTRGNVLLHGWALTSITFYTTDLPFYVAGMALHGFSPALLREVPAVIYALLVLAAVALAGRGQIADRRALGRTVAFVLLGLPSLLVPQIVLVGVNHVATTLLMTLALLALDGSEGGKRRLPLAIFSVLLALTLFGDTMAVVVLLLPLLLVCAARVVQDRTRWAEEQGLVAAILAGFGGSLLLMVLLRLAGGFEISAPVLKLTYLETVPRNVVVTVRSLLQLFRADFFGADVGLRSVGLSVGLLGLGFVLYSFRLGLGQWRRGAFGGDRVTLTLTAAILVNLLAYLVNYDVISPLNTLYSPPERYLVPFFVFSAILAGRLGAAQVPDVCRFRLGLTALTLAYAGFFAAQLQAPRVDLPADHLGCWLASHGLRDGYGNFWCANVVTAETGGRVRVRAVTAYRSGKLLPMRWYSKADWYRRTPAHFLVFNASHFNGRAFRWGDVGLPKARRTFGAPDQTAQVGPYTILIWKKDVTPLLAARAVP